MPTVKRQGKPGGRTTHYDLRRCLQRDRMQKVWQEQNVAEREEGGEGMSIKRDLIPGQIRSVASSLVEDNALAYFLENR
jgi:hypothetical protein